ncbi:MAG: Smr/MutS family protein [Deltaproteobacteria bacterium]|nr:MAG: Smr/MutS family protein [Deltaproteobacteria bacterium]
METEIDLHGLRLLEAEAEVMRFVDQLYFNGETSGKIIHGMGMIAEKLPQWLRNYPYVKSFERSSFNAGVTNVFLEFSGR